jgi:aquaporin Z
MLFLRRHWPEYLIEAAGLAAFMLSACGFGVLLEHPASPVRRAIDDPLPRRALMGVAMGLTAAAIIYSPWGQRSGAHLNPSVTLTFLRLGKMKPADALFYVVAQVAGAIAGVALASIALGARLAHPSANFVVTAPGPDGAGAAFAAEALISAGMMALVLSVSGSRFARWTGALAGALVATYITLEAPLSGMSMNPARTLGSAIVAGQWGALWVYFTAPPLGMLLAAEVCRRFHQARGCAKMDHPDDRPCIHCGQGGAWTERGQGGSART